MYIYCQSQPKQTKEIQTLKRILLSNLSMSMTMQQIKQYIPTINQFRITQSKLERKSFMERPSMQKPQTRVIRSTATNKSIQFAIDSTKELRHDNAYSQKVIKTSDGGTFVPSALRDSTITHQYNVYQQKCNNMGYQSMSLVVFSSIIKAMTNKAATMQACQDSILIKHLHEQILDLKSLLSKNTIIFKVLLLLFLCV